MSCRIYFHRFGCSVAEWLLWSNPVRKVPVQVVKQRYSYLRDYRDLLVVGLPMCRKRCIFVKTCLTCVNIRSHDVLAESRRNHSSSVDSSRVFNTVEEFSSVTVSQMRKVFKANGVNFKDGFACFIVDCPNCAGGRRDVTVTGKMYVNKTTGFLSCQRCHVAGQWESLEGVLHARKQGGTLLPQELARLQEGGRAGMEVARHWQQLKRSTRLLADLPEDEARRLLDSFNLPVSGARPQLEGRVDAEGRALYFPLHGCEGQVAGYKVVQRGDPGEQTVPATGCGGVLVLSPGKGVKQDAAVLVASVADLLALVGHKVPALVCLPHGVCQLPQQVLPVLERFPKLVLWLGGDAAGWHAAPTFARKLGEQRCHLVRQTAGQLSPRQAVLRGRDARTIVLHAQPVLHQSITTFASLREDVLSELHNIDKVAGVKWKRFPVLNRILKGHRRGELTLVTGPTGSGKTTLMSEYSLDLACQGVNTLWGSFEIHNVRLARTMLQQLAGRLLDQDLEQFEVWADRFERLPLHFTTFHGQQAAHAVMEALEHAAYVHDIAHVVIDNVQFMMGVEEVAGRHMDRFWRQDAVVAGFRTFATRRDCHVTLVMHPRKERDAEDLTPSSIFGSAKAAQEADNILIIQDKRLSAVRGKKYLQVAKNRYTGDLGIMALEFDKDSLSFAQRKKVEKDKLTDT